VIEHQGTVLLVRVMQAGNEVKLGFDGPKEMAVLRREVWDAKQAEARNA